MLILLFSCFLLPASCTDDHNNHSDFRLTVLHNNDFHTRYLPINSRNYAECNPEALRPDCVGGVARTVAEIRQQRALAATAGDAFLYLNAGDHFQGTFWYTVKKSKLVAAFVSLMGADAMAVGNHEFDDGPQELATFFDLVSLADSNWRLLSANIELVNRSSSPLADMIQKSTVRRFGNVSVAIIGYTTPETVYLSKPGNSIRFRDEVEAIKEEIARLEAAHDDLKIFIAVGHSGYERDQEIAAAIPQLDLIVGGHSNSFLWPRKAGENLPSSEKPEGDYPTVVRHPDTGDQTLIVQAFAYGKYLGKLDLVFDDQGRVVHFEGRPIFLNASYPEDFETKELVRAHNARLTADMSTPIGFTEIDLEAPDVCRVTECSIGNLVADAMASSVEYGRALAQPTGTSSEFAVCNASLALVLGGNIRSSIISGNITYAHILSTLPFTNQEGAIWASGRLLLDVFRHSAALYRWGGFLQVSSRLRVTYQQQQPSKSGDHHHHQSLVLKKLEARCGNHPWTEVSPDGLYHLAINTYLSSGGDNYTMLMGRNWTDYGFSDVDGLTRYIKRLDNVTVGIEGRITVLSAEANGSGKSSAAKLWNTLVNFVVAAVLILQLI